MNIEKNLISAINMGMRSKSTSIVVRGTKAMISLLKKLEAEGVIRGFTIVDFEKLKVNIFLKYKKNKIRLIQDIKSYGTSKAKVYLTGKQMNTLKNDFNIYIVSTRIGLQTTTEVKTKIKELKLNIGGELKYIVPINEIYTRIKEQKK